MTETVKQKLKEELKVLETELNIHLPKEIKKAVEFGDLRENAEYKAALERQEFVRAKISQLHKRLTEIESIDLSRIPSDKAAYGSTLKLFDPDLDEEIIYRLVTPEESDPEKGLISTSSPIGSSLLGKEEGDEVRVKTPSGWRTFEILQLTTLHDQQS